MIEDAAVTVFHAELEKFKLTTLSEIREFYPYDFLPIQDPDYPCSTTDWLESGKPKRTGNQVDQEIYLASMIYAADSCPGEARKQLRKLIGPWQRAMLSIRGGASEGHIFTFHPGPVKSGSTDKAGTHSAAAFCRITVKQRGPS